MKVFIPTKDRADNMLVPLAVQHEDFFELYVVMHNKDQMQEYIRGDRLPSMCTPIISDTPADTYGLTRQREYIMNTIAEPGEWFLFMDDNVTVITGVHPMYAASTQLETNKIIRNERFPRAWRDVYSYVPTAKELVDMLEDTIGECERIGAYMAGFATTDNPYFRSKKFRSAGYVSGKMMLWKADPNFQWDHEISMEDYRNTAEHCRMHGAVCINNFIYPMAKHYQQGGMGTREHRMPVRKQDVARLLATYPGFFRVKDHVDWSEKDVDLAVRLSSTKQILKWRTMLARSIEQAQAIK